MNDSLMVFCDGGARGNPGPAASAFVIQDFSGNTIFESGKEIGPATNNQAEYQAVILALEWLAAKSYPDQEVTFFLDSLLVVNQINGLFKIKDQKLKDKYQTVYTLIKGCRLNIRSFEYIPRRKNTRADFLVNQALDKSKGNK
jgi:ribonuclease HI